MNMVGNQVLSVIDPDFIGNATEWLVLCQKHRCTDSSRNQQAVRRIIAEDPSHGEALSITSVKYGRISPENARWEGIRRSRTSTCKGALWSICQTMRWGS